MKRIILYLTVGTTLIACSQKADPDEQRMKRYLIFEQLTRNQRYTARIIEDAGKSEKPSVLSAIKGTNMVTSARNEYITKSNIDALIKYSNAIMMCYDTLVPKDPTVVNAIKKYHKNVLNRRDSVSIENLYSYILFVEKAILEHYASEVDGGDWMTNAISNTIRNASVTPDDTVLVLLNTFAYWEPGKIDFSNVNCTNQETGNKLKPKISKFKQFYLFEYRPKETGTYFIDGTVGFIGGYDRVDFPITNKFKVE